MLDGNRRWAQAVGARHRPRPPRRRGQHRAAARLVRGGRHRGRHPVAALDRQPQPAAAGARAAARHHRRRRRRARRAAALAAPPGRRARPAAGRPPSGSRRPRSRPATSTGCWSTSPSGTAAAARSPTPSGRCSTSTPPGHLARGARRGHRRRAHRRAPLHQGPARPRPGHPHLRRAAARRLPAVAERASEFYFCEAYWPDFRRVDFLRAIRAYAHRERNRPASAHVTRGWACRPGWRRFRTYFPGTRSATRRSRQEAKFVAITATAPTRARPRTYAARPGPGTLLRTGAPTGACRSGEGTPVATAKRAENAPAGRRTYVLDTSCCSPTPVR